MTEALTIEQETNLTLVERAQRLLCDVVFLDYQWLVAISHGGVTLRARYEEPDVVIPGSVPTEQLTRKWLLHPDMTDAEIVSTAFKCAVTSMEHRTREHFTFKGFRIYSPHHSLDFLVAACREFGADTGARKEV